MAFPTCEVPVVWHEAHPNPMKRVSTAKPHTAGEPVNRFDISQLCDYLNELLDQE